MPGDGPDAFGLFPFALKEGRSCRCPSPRSRPARWPGTAPHRPEPVGGHTRRDGRRCAQTRCALSAFGSRGLVGARCAGTRQLDLDAMTKHDILAALAEAGEAKAPSMTSGPTTKRRTRRSRSGRRDELRDGHTSEVEQNALAEFVAQVFVSGQRVGPRGIRTGEGRPVRPR